MNGIMIPIADSLLELHIVWCGAPIHPNHNPACKIAYERFQNDTREVTRTTDRVS